VDFSHTAGFPVQQGLSFKDIATDNKTTVQPGEYDIVANCVDSFAQDVKGTFTTKLWFTSATTSGESTFGAIPGDNGTPGGTGGGQAGEPDAAKGLASTRVPTGYLVLLAVALLGAGIVAVRLSRRRKREAVVSAWPERPWSTSGRNWSRPALPRRSGSPATR
jgi:hypothetical protein